jgi:hypothetical protein
MTAARTPADRAREECRRQGLEFAITDRVAVAAIVSIIRSEDRTAAPEISRPGAAKGGRRVAVNLP